MVRRTALAALWFVSTWLAYGLVAYFLGVPDTGGAVIGALIAALVWIDPTGALWSGKARATSPRDRASSLDPTAEVASQP